MKFEKFDNLTSKIKELSLSGETSHAKLSPPYRLELAKKMMGQNIIPKKAAVLLLLYPNKDNETTLVLILRKAYNGVHSSQVGCPGGKPEQQDKNLQDTAVRETQEEIGVNPNDITVIRALSNIYIPPSNYNVQPFLAKSKKHLTFKKQDDEVEGIIHISLAELLDKKNLVSKKVKTSYNIEVVVPAFQFGEHTVWGATAMMLSELIDLITAVNA